MNEVKFTIKLPPITKKNSMQVGTNRYTGKTFVTQSKQYKQYEKDVANFIPVITMIDKPINIKALFYMPTKRKVDKLNLEAALHDILVKYEVLLDDNSDIVVSTDGTRVYKGVGSENARTEVTITYLEEAAE